VTQTAPSPEHLKRESFFGVVLRRARYAVAILFSAFLFSTLAWKFAAPPAEYGGLSLVIWGGVGGGVVQSVITGILLAVLLFVSAAVCTLLVHPDNPHMGLFCALLGMTGLSIRGGTIYYIIRRAQENPDTYRAAMRLLAFECLQWGVIAFVVALAVQFLHKRFFHNHHWIIRSAGDATPPDLSKIAPGHSVLGVARSVGSTTKTHHLSPAISAPLATLVAGILGFIFLYAFLQSQAKGQVLLACFAAFYIAGILTYVLFPKAPVLAFVAAVPLTAAVGCFYAASQSDWPLGKPGFFPGQAHFFMNRALPIDYITAGIPGVLLGYYHGFWWSLHSHEE
jgi:hypothetical protein